jgi:hypothetical protein
MIRRPIAVGLLLCQEVIVEERTRNVTLVNSFGRLGLKTFPSPPQQFTVQAVLADGLGEVRFELVISSLDNLEPIYTRSWRTTFTDPLREVRHLIRVGSCSFPAPGRYQVGLLAENEPVAQCLLTIDPLEAGP